MCKHNEENNFFTACGEQRYFDVNERVCKGKEKTYSGLLTSLVN